MITVIRRRLSPANHRDYERDRARTAEQLTAERDAGIWRPSAVAAAASQLCPWRSLGERGLADRDQQVMPHLGGEHVILVLKPDKLGFQVTYSLLQAAHL